MSNYSQSAEAFELADGHILRCNCRNMDGDYVSSELDLDTIIGNNDGQFAWGGQGWSQGAGNPNLEEGWRLTADLPGADGGQRDRATIDLNEKIGNDNGKLVYSG
ncbi:Cyanovirin-N [Cryomyces antarcticus]|uniref:Cyanovirin-N domain-containing protein n=1 Tax=Cryomyces antarcticus TaxID=329879 RepID=A0ABR0LQV4_9PEZI|nr:hypothetical protein LTR39_000467 [Cryomyces antarcticus]KAK5020681.1 hypothetical protein LTR60_000311 [Cryomyces antarcticus]KAK5162567.1 hypothetical protein LTR04_003404 [Oleoguttula sp. CCFEE 6159]KAK5202019.1 hypothetical protein LTR16_000687 [Cryomyces antarcticus]